VVKMRVIANTITVSRRPAGQGATLSGVDLKHKVERDSTTGQAVAVAASGKGN